MRKIKLKNIKQIFKALKFPLIFLAVTFILFRTYTFNLRPSQSADPLPNNLTALSLVEEGDFDLNEFKKAFEKREGMKSMIRYGIDGYWLPGPPAFMGVVSFPIFYLNKIFYLKNVEAPHPFSLYYSIVGKLSGAFYTALSGALIFLVFWELSSKKLWITLLSTLAYGLGTQAFSVASQGNWQHGPSLFFLSFFLYVFILSEKENNRGQRKAKWFSLGMGFLLGLAALCRVSNGIVVLAALAYFFITRRDGLLYVCLGGLPSLIFNFVYARVYFGKNIYITNIDVIFKSVDPQSEATPFFQALKGLFFSPSVSPFLLHPILFLALIGLLIFLFKLVLGKQIKFKKVYIFCFSVFMLFIIFCAKYRWWSVGNWGSRMLMEGILFLVPFWFFLWRSFKNIFNYFYLFLLLVSIYSCILAVYSHDNRWRGIYLFQQGLRGHENQGKAIWFNNEIKPFFYHFKRDYYFTSLVKRNHKVFVVRKTFSYEKGEDRRTERKIYCGVYDQYTIEGKSLECKKFFSTN